MNPPEEKIRAAGAEGKSTAPSSWKPAAASVRGACALSINGGDTAAAAAMCGIAIVPRNARALWGRSAVEARSTYRPWQKSRGK